VLCSTHGRTLHEKDAALHSHGLPRLHIACIFRWLLYLEIYHGFVGGGLIVNTILAPHSACRVGVSERLGGEKRGRKCEGGKQVTRGEEEMGGRWVWEE
jgi:hypothetical protein